MTLPASPYLLGILLFVVMVALSVLGLPSLWAILAGAVIVGFAFGKQHKAAISHRFILTTSAIVGGLNLVIGIFFLSMSEQGLTEVLPGTAIAVLMLLVAMFLLPTVISFLGLSVGNRVGRGGGF